MTKLCPRGKAAAKRKFRVYPSAYANAYASKICAGKIKDPSGVKRKDFKGRKPAQDGGSIGRGLKEPVKTPIMRAKDKAGENARKMFDLKMKQFEKLKELKKNQRPVRRKKMMGGGLTEATQRLRRQGLKKGGSISDAPTDPRTGALILTPKKLKMAIESGHADKQIDKKTGRIIYKRSPLKKSGPFEGLKRKKQIRNKSTPKFKAIGGRINYRKGGGVCLRGMNREAVGKNS